MRAFAHYFDLSVILLAAVLVGAGTGCKSGPQAAGDETPSETASKTPRTHRASVVLYRYQFNPDELTIESGTTVAFRNKDVETHAIEIESLDLEHQIEPNDTWSHTFETTGEFQLANPEISHSMTMTLVVE